MGEGDIVANRVEQNMSLFQLESELAELMAFRDQEELTPEERAAVDGQIGEYVKRELTKVDNLRSYMRHCAIMADAAKEEADRQSRRAASWKNRLDYLKGCCLDAMNVIGKKRLDGRTGYLISKANGGKQALTITDPEIVPDQYCCYEGRIPAFIWNQITQAALRMETEYNRDAEMRRDIEGLHLVRSTNNEAIREAMDLSCVQCGGLGTQCPAGPSDAPLNTCSGCDGSGKTRVPGARLEPRGTHVEVK